jgi:exosortase K
MKKLDLVLIALTVAAAYAVKRHFSEASVDDLGWILAPTAALVERILQTPFVAEAGVGYLSREHAFVIAKPCAGVNFFIVAACAAVIGLVHTRRTAAGKLLLVAGGVAGAYAATLCANAVRIAIAVSLQDDLATAGAEMRERVHRLEGVVVYAVFLFALYAASRRALAPRQPC